MTSLGKLNTKLICYTKNLGAESPVIIYASLHIFCGLEEPTKLSGTMSLRREICGNRKGRTSGVV